MPLGTALLGGGCAGSLRRARELEAIGYLQITLAAGEKVSWTGGLGIVTGPDPQPLAPRTLNAAPLTIVVTGPAATSARWSWKLSSTAVILRRTSSRPAATPTGSRHRQAR